MQVESENLATESTTTNHTSGGWECEVEGGIAGEVEDGDADGGRDDNGEDGSSNDSSDHEVALPGGGTMVIYIHTCAMVLSFSYF